MGTVLLCLLAIIILIGVAAYISWPYVLGIVAAIVVFRLAKNFFTSRG